MIRHEFTLVFKLDHELMHFLYRVLAMKGGMTAEEVKQAQDRLTATIATDMTQAQVSEAQAGFRAISDRLHALGQDPANPVPPPPVAFKNLKK